MSDFLINTRATNSYNISFTLLYKLIKRAWKLSTCRDFNCNTIFICVKLNLLSYMLAVIYITAAWMNTYCIQQLFKSLQTWFVFVFFLLLASTYIFTYYNIEIQMYHLKLRLDKNELIAINLWKLFFWYYGLILQSP